MNFEKIKMNNQKMEKDKMKQRKKTGIKNGGGGRGEKK
jgi:hypothetical protein